jgi:hypothetical protein
MTSKGERTLKWKVEIKNRSERKKEKIEAKGRKLKPVRPFFSGDIKSIGVNRI